MTKKAKYEPDTRRLAVARALARSPDETIESIADSCGVVVGTLKFWLKSERRQQRATSTDLKSGSLYTPAEQLEALLATAGMSSEARSAWCRERGLFAHQLEAWKKQLSAPKVDESAALKESRRQAEQLQRELNRKDKALAEAAALLVLQKKFQSLFPGEES